MTLTIVVDDEVLRRDRIRALEQGTSVNGDLILTEDLQAGQDFDGLTVVNPF